jgi:hypothetical protein
MQPVRTLLHLEFFRCSKLLGLDKVKPEELIILWLKSAAVKDLVPQV